MLTRPSVTRPRPRPVLRRPRQRLELTRPRPELPKQAEHFSIPALAFD